MLPTPLFHSNADAILQNEVQYLAPEELGHAAAYEAYRTWIYNRSMHEPFGLDPERQREALTGLAVAEGGAR